MKTTYSIYAWEDAEHPAQFSIERLSKKNAAMIFESFTKNERWLMVTCRRDTKAHAFQDSTPILSYRKEIGTIRL